MFPREVFVILSVGSILVSIVGPLCSLSANAVDARGLVGFEPFLSARTYPARCASGEAAGGHSHRKEGRSVQGPQAIFDGGTGEGGPQAVSGRQKIGVAAEDGVPSQTLHSSKRTNPAV
jgi:hypothetical protein